MAPMMRMRGCHLRAGVDLVWHRFRPRVVEPGADPLLLIHGFACGKGEWGAIPKFLGTRARREVIVFDNRGVGESRHESGGYSVAQMAGDALAVLDAAGVERAGIMGASLGGMIAQDVALEYPDRVSSLILGCTSHGGRQAIPLPSQFVELCTAWAADPLPNENHALFDSFCRYMLPPALHEQPDGHKLFEDFATAFRKTRRSAAGLGGQLAAMGRFNSTKRLDQLSIPALVICGSEDAVLPPANSSLLAQRIPGAELEVWKDAGHFWWEHRADEVAQLLADFLHRTQHRNGA
jgi:3-oxoadipate enol-lactonase